ncbi:MAG: glucosyltransferase domain-containing protein [Holosporaceae bacterium]|jgi:hypothetical protein|nr:glucosyltransferase domain-containing protein [Holosporaceae bacterium]
MYKNFIDILPIANKKHLIKAFLFFLLIAICGYLSIMTSFSAYKDDHCRYLSNYPVGIYAGRSAALLLEILLFFSTMAYDVAPFSTILSCAFLACTATICQSIFKNVSNVDDWTLKNDRWTLLCFTPMAVNPYLVENMIFRFDNPFMTLAMLCAVLSAYLASIKKYSDDQYKNISTNDLPSDDGKWRQWLPTQIILLLLSLLLYQAALSAYCVICAYALLANLARNQPLSQAISEMRHWFYSLLCAVLAYAPLIIMTTIFDSTRLLGTIPRNVSEIANNIAQNVALYFHGLFVNWSCNAVGIIFALIFIIFSISFAIDVLKQTQRRAIAILRIVMILIALCIFCISPLGVDTPLNLSWHTTCREIRPRTLYAFGILISAVLYKNYLFIGKRAAAQKIYRIFLSCFCLWNIGFVNSVGNLMHAQRILQDNVFYDLSKDIFKIKAKYGNLRTLFIDGNVRTPAMKNFSRLYPLCNQIMPECWDMALYNILGLHTYGMNMSNSMIGTRKQIPPNRIMLKSRLWYNIYSIDDVIIYVQLKGSNHKEDTLDWTIMLKI